MKVHVARQPIFDRRLIVYGYELLYRSSAQDDAFTEGFDGTTATSRVMLEAFYGAGLDQFTGRKRAFVNFTMDLLTNEMATLFPPDKLVIEVLETIKGTDEVLEALRDLKLKGFEIALDDYVLTAETEPLLEVADIIKVDFLESTIPQIEELMFKAPRNIRYLAEKIDSRKAYNKARELGFEYFQGYFLNKPETFSSEDLTPLQINYLDLIRYLNRANFDIKHVEDIIQRDVALSFKLLKLVNSVAFGMRFRINSIHHALVILGQEETRKWITLLSMMSINENQNEELLKQSLIRAKFAESLGRRIYRKYDDRIDSLFMLGLFSLIDAIVNKPMEEVFSSIKVVDPNVLDALIKGEGEFMPYYKIVVAYEHGDIERAVQEAAKLGIRSEDVADDFQDALGWCVRIFD